MRTVLKSLCIALSLIAASASPVHAEQIDASFGTNGRFIPSFATPNLRAIAMLERPNGKLVAIAKTDCSSDNSCLKMFFLNSSGQLELGGEFNTLGIESIAAAVMDNNGRIVVVGTTAPASVTGRDFSVQRFIPTTYGYTNDTNFGINGRTTVSFSNGDDSAKAVAIDANDNVVVVGKVAFSATDDDFAIARLRGSDGAPDTTFNGIGRSQVAFDLGSSLKLDVATAVGISSSNGRITVAGTAFDSAVFARRVALVRYNSNGSLDSTFCPAATCNTIGTYSPINNGRRVYFFGYNNADADNVYGIAVAANGEFVIVGENNPTNNSGKRGAITHFLVNGDYSEENLNDGLFGNAAYRGVRLSGVGLERIVVSGDSGPTQNFLLLQAFNKDLTPLIGYGSCVENGICTGGSTFIADYGPDVAATLTLDNLGRPLFAGSFVDNNGDPIRALFARFTNTDRIFRNGFE